MVVACAQLQTSDLDWLLSCPCLAPLPLPLVLVVVVGGWWSDVLRFTLYGNNTREQTQTP